ncbi:MAG: DUF1778 domain-containing protein [Rhizobiales bacterium]|nr:DUF1778 domain-containing protein [Hyphomicrobiales bacterium]
MSDTTARSARLEARLSPEALALVKRAAEIEGRSVSDFVVTAAQNAARRTVADAEVIRLSRAAQEKFAALLLNPPQPSSGLKRAVKRHRRLIGDVR